VRLKTFTFLCSKLIQETIRQISSESPEFCGRYYEKQFGLIFFDTLDVHMAITAKTHYPTARAVPGNNLVYTLDILRIIHAEMR